MKAKRLYQEKSQSTIRPEIEGLERRTLLSAYTFQTLALFNVTDGGNPYGNLTLDSSGDLFGTTKGGGASGDGTVFEILHNTTSIITLATFNGSSGEGPIGSIVLDSSGDVFGTTNVVGTVFDIVHKTTSITTLAGFNNANGYDPEGGLVLDSSGDLFGTTAQGGANFVGTVFEIVGNGTSISTLATFNGTNGDYPKAGVLMDSSGNLFGSTQYGGPQFGTGNDHGTVFEVPFNTTSIMTVASFNGANGEDLIGGLTLDSSGDLLGTTSGGGASSDGTVFEIPYNTTSVTTLATFNGADGNNPTAGVLMDSAGDLFGTTDGGGAGNEGTVFEVAQGTTSITTLFNFNGTNGGNPYGGVTLDSSGDLFGATESGGDANGDGTVFELVPPPTATPSAPNVTSAGGTTESITVVYTDDIAVNAASIVPGNITISGPAGSLNVMGVSLNPNANAATITATYTVAAPDGSWSPADDGTYTVNLLADQVTDTSGNAAAAAQTTFSVNTHSTIPVATITAPDVVSASAGNETITIVYSDAETPINTGTVGASNLTVSGPAGSLMVMLMGTSGAGNTITATYNAAAPAGGWSAADDGAYTVSVLAGSVEDQVGNAVAATTGTFAVNLSADPTFAAASGGSVNLPFVAEQSLALAGGQILLVGNQGISDGAESQGVLEELNPDGTPDPDFNSGNSVTTGLNEGFYAASVQSNGQIIAVGNSGGSFLVAGYNSNGSIDTSFGTDGFATANFGTGDAIAYSVAIEPDGSIVVAGFAGGKAALALFDANGNLDPILNPGGTTDPSFPAGGLEAIAGTTSPLQQVLILSGSGKIMGLAANGASVTVLRLNLDGAPDPSFGIGGTTTVSALSSEDTEGNPVPIGIAADSGGSILVTAQVAGANGVGVVRLLSNGLVDPNFGTNGISSITFGGGPADHACVVDVNPSNGTIVLVGTTIINDVAQTTVATFDSDGALDSSFGDNGTLLLPAVPNSVSADGLTSPLSSPAGGPSIQAGSVAPFIYNSGIYDALVAIDAQQRILLGSVNVAQGSSSIRRLNPATPKLTLANGTGAVGRKPLKFAFDGMTVTITMQGGTGTVDEEGSQLDLTLTPSKPNGSDSLTITTRGGKGPLGLASVMQTTGKLAAFNAPNAILAGMMSISGAIGTLKLSGITGDVTAADISNLTAGAMNGSISCGGTIGVARLSGAITGTIEAGVIQNLSAPALSGAMVIAGVNGPGDIGSLVIGGTIADSFIGAGVNSDDGIFGPTGDTAAPGPSLIKSLTIRNGILSGTVFEAAIFPKVVHIPNPIRPSADTSQFVML